MIAFFRLWAAVLASCLHVDGARWVADQPCNLPFVNSGTINHPAGIQDLGGATRLALTSVFKIIWTAGFRLMGILAFC